MAASGKIPPGDPRSFHQLVWILGGKCLELEATHMHIRYFNSFMPRLFFWSIAVGPVPKKKFEMGKKYFDHKNCVHAQLWDFCYVNSFFAPCCLKSTKTIVNVLTLRGHILYKVRQSAFKWAHYTVTASSNGIAAKDTVRADLSNSGRCLLRPVEAGQSQGTELFWEGRDLKRQALKQTGRETEEKITCFLSLFLFSI